MKLIEVKDQNTSKEFLMFPVGLYKNEPHWIRPLDKDLDKVFDKEQNKYFRNGELIRWILKDDQGKVIGRVAAFINQRTVKKDNDQPTGGIGFFDCIHDKEAAFTLFDGCKTGSNPGEWRPWTALSILVIATNGGACSSKDLKKTRISIAITTSLTIRSFLKDMDFRHILSR